MIVLSRNMQEYFRNTYERDTRFIPNGITAKEIVPADRINASFGLGKDGYFLFLGRIVPEKGVHYLIEAFRKVHTDRKLVIAGGSSDSSDYQRHIQGHGGIRSTHRVDRIRARRGASGAVQQRLCVRDAFRSGSMPMSLLEAMAYGNCCLTSDIPVCAEVVEDKALTFPHGSVDDLAAMLQKMADDPAIVTRYKREAAGFITGKYSWDRVVDQTLALYAGDKDGE